jgi:hypothetical protein
MERPVVDKCAYLQNLQRQEVYENDVETDMYLGFLLPTYGGVVLRQVEKGAAKHAPHVVTRSVATLLERK